MAERLEFDDIALSLIAPFEGCHKLKDGLVYPYLDKLAKPPVWTQGYGITYGITEDSPPITRQRALDDLQTGIRRYGLRVLRLAPALAARPACHGAVTSWAWNVGLGAFQASRMRRAINEGRWDDAAQLILKPDTAGGVVYRGLQRRRLEEQRVFISGI